MGLATLGWGLAAVAATVALMRVMASSMASPPGFAGTGFGNAGEACNARLRSCKGLRALLDSSGVAAAVALSCFDAAFRRWKAVGFSRFSCASCSLTEVTVATSGLDAAFDHA